MDCEKEWCTSLTSNVSHLSHWKFHCGFISHSFSTCHYVYLHKIVWLLHERGHNYTNITFLLGSQNSTDGVERSFWFGRDDIGDLCPLYTKTPKPPPFPAPINYVGIRKKVDWQQNTNIQKIHLWETDSGEEFLKLLPLLPGPRVGQEGDIHRWCFDVSASCHQDLSQSGYSQGDIHLSTSGKVEGVEGHLGGGFTNRLWEIYKFTCSTFIFKKRSPMREER